MAKLYFRYGTMGSAKTLNLLAVAYNYRQQHKSVMIIKPAIDQRYGVGTVQSRAGLAEEATLLVQDNDHIVDKVPVGTACILVDEAQFLSTALVDQLRDIATFQGVPVICYGLRTDFRGHLFAGAKRLFELADTLEELKTTCAYCDRKAILNLREAAPLRENVVVDIGGDDKYQPACYRCYHARTHTGVLLN